MSFDSAALRADALSQVPRILGLGDRDADSPAYGCFDRNYWQYRLHDVANARFQEVALLLARLFRGQDARYAAHPKIAAWAGAAVRFWLNARNRDGSVNEVYPHERGFCATSFSAWSVAEAVALVPEACPDPRELVRTGEWLARHDNVEVANQQAACALALLNIGLATGELRFCDEAKRKLLGLFNRLSPEGLLLEYGAPDLGYTSITLGLLARFNRKQPLEDICRVAQLNLQWLDRLVSEDGTFDAAQGSRRTQYLYLYGVVAWKHPLADRLQRGIEAGRVVTPGMLDDRYCIQLATDYVETADVHDTLEAPGHAAVPGDARPQRLGRPLAA